MLSPQSCFDMYCKKRSINKGDLTWLARVHSLDQLFSLSKRGKTEQFNKWLSRTSPTRWWA